MKKETNGTYNEKKILIGKIGRFCLCILFLAVIAAGCANHPSGPAAKEGIAFEYFYRGFTPLTDDTDIDAFKALSGVEVIQTEEDWHDFRAAYCQGILYFIDVDYSKECLIAFSNLYGAKSSYNVSSDIKAITVVDNHIEAIEDHDEQNPSERICALNAGVGHWYVNIVKVKKSDLPPEVEGVYKKQHVIKSSEMLTPYDAEMFTAPIRLSFQEDSLSHTALKPFTLENSTIILKETRIDNIRQTFYKSADDADTNVYSFIEIKGKAYFLGAVTYSQTDYLEYYELNQVNLPSQNPIYSYPVGHGANYMQMQYITVSEDKPYLLYQIDCANDIDVDGDGQIESVYIHNWTYMLYEWNIAQNSIRYASINDALNCGSDQGGLDLRGNIFWVKYYDAVTESTVDVALQYFDGALSRIEHPAV